MTHQNQRRRIFVDRPIQGPSGWSEILNRFLMLESSPKKPIRILRMEVSSTLSMKPRVAHGIIPRFLEALVSQIDDASPYTDTV